MVKEVIHIGVDPQTQRTLEIAHKAASSSASILINGETGVGKELIARYIHSHSLVSTGPFISVNCAALPANMIEAVLFGYEKGAFTNAINTYIGKFEQAHNGTLLLDEVSEIPLELQAKLLRVLQEREVERLGGKKVITINTRIISATNCDLPQLVKTGLFRSDLYYRLNVIPIHCSALRNRPNDIIPLAEHLLNKHALMLGRKSPILTSNAKYKLQTYPWPGNVREMENTMQRALIMTLKDIIDAEDISLNEDMLQDCHTLPQIDSTLKVMEAQKIIDVLNETDGRRNIAAKRLNISPRTLRYKISKLKSIGVKVP
jgi:two-component system response regulator FlrC